MDNTEALLFELRRTNQLLRELPSAIAVAVAARHRGETSADKDVLRVLLPALEAAVGRSTFTLKDLEEQTHLYEPLRDALLELGRIGITRRKLGKLFARVEGMDLDGAVIWQRESTRDGKRWQILRL